MFRYVLIAWGEIIYNRTSFATCDFDPRPTTWATKFKCVRANKILISIRAPPQGGDVLISSLIQQLPDFQSTPRHKGRHTAAFAYIHNRCTFQSTPRHKGATAIYCPYTAPHPTSTQSTLSLSALSHKTTTIIPRYQRKRSGILCALPFRTGKSTLLL